MQIPVGYAHVVHRFRGDSLPRGAAVTYGIQLNGGSWDPGDAGLLHDAFADTLVNELDNTVVMYETLLKAGPNDDGPFTVFTQDRSGGQSAAGASPQVAYLIEKRTASGGRRNRGRMYLPGVPEANVNEAGVIETSSLAALNTQADAFLARIQEHVLQMVILHTGPSAPTVVTELSADPVVATQRRRLRR